MLVFEFITISLWKQLWLDHFQTMPYTLVDMLKQNLGSLFLTVTMIISTKMSEELLQVRWASCTSWVFELSWFPLTLFKKRRYQHQWFIVQKIELRLSESGIFHPQKSKKVASAKKSGKQINVCLFICKKCICSCLENFHKYPYLIYSKCVNVIGAFVCSENFGILQCLSHGIMSRALKSLWKLLLDI